MFIFLGLNARPTHLAWMSILILAITCGYSVYWFDRIENDQTQFFRSEKFQEAIHLRENLARLHCSRHRMSQAQCSKLESLAGTKILFETNTLLKYYEKKTFAGEAPNVLREQEMSDPIMSFLNLLEYGSRAENRVDFTDASYSQTYLQYSVLKNQVFADYKVFLKSHRLLTRLTLTPINLFRSHFLHGGWLHLIGNMIFFIVFAVFVESRLGAVPLFLIYFGGGSIGMFLQTRFFLEPSVHLIGASGCVSAVLGASLALFWRQRVKVWVSLVFYNRVILVPALVALPFLTLAQDLIGAADSTSNIGHIAHLGGFFSGFILAKIFEFMDPLPKQFIFAEEFRLFRVFKKKPEIRKKVSALKRILHINPDNLFVLERGSRWAQSEMVRSAGFFKDHLSFVSQMIGLHLREKLRNQSPEEIIHYIACLPPQLDYNKVLKYVPVSLQLGVQDAWILSRKYSLTLEESLQIENRLSKKDSEYQWSKIIYSIETDLTQISELERDNLIRVYEKYSKARPNHAQLKKLSTQIKSLKERSYVRTA